jgi:hypothetical protein
MGGHRLMALGQGIALVGLGAWPIASMRTFEQVTGPKHDDWLVRTVGGLCVAIGTGLIGRQRPGRGRATSGHCHRHHVPRRGRHRRPQR